MEKGVRQDCPMSLALFNIYIINWRRKSSSRKRNGGKKPGSQNLKKNAELL